MTDRAAMTSRGSLLTAFIALLCAGYVPAVAAARATRAGSESVAWMRVVYAPGLELTDNAVLTATDAHGRLGFGAVSASDQAVVPHSSDIQDPSLQTGVHAFGKPAGGWSSGVSGAQLTASDDGRLGAVATSGGTAVVGNDALGNSGPVNGYVFTEPSEGWSGALHESAKLVASGAGSGLRAGPSPGCEAMRS